MGIFGVAGAACATGNTKKRSYLQYDLRQKATAPFRNHTTFENNNTKSSKCFRRENYKRCPLNRKIKTEPEKSLVMKIVCSNYPSTLQR